MSLKLSQMSGSINPHRELPNPNVVQARGQIILPHKHSSRRERARVHLPVICLHFRSRQVRLLSSQLSPFDWEASYDF